MAIKMMIQVQSTKQKPENYMEIDSADWPNLPDVPVHHISCQGIGFAGDHYAVEDIPDSGVRITVWNDDPEDWESHEYWAEQWDIYPLTPDIKIGEKYNTKQFCRVYAPEGNIEHDRTKRENVDVFMWDSFFPPANEVIRKGVWVSDELQKEHEDIRIPKSWRCWIADVPPELIEDGELIRQ